MVQRQTAQPQIGRRDSDADPGADRVPELVPVCELDRLGPPARARRVDDAVDVLGLHALVEVDPGRFGRFERVARGPENDARRETGDEALELGAGEAGIERGHDRTQLHERVQQHHVLRRGLERKRHAIVPADAEPGQPGRRFARAHVELAVRDGLIARDQRDVVGDRLGRGGKPAVDLHELSKALSLPGMSISWASAATYNDIRYETGADDASGIAKITIARPEVRNAFRPETLIEISEALESAREDTSIGVIVLTGEGPDAFCSGGDQRVRGDSGYVAGGASVGRFHVTDLHVQMRRLPKPIVAMVAGYAIGGGHVLHVVCDLTIAADNARFGQTGPRVGSFDGGFGAALLASQVGQKKAKEIWFLCRQYSAPEALEMGLVNTVVPLDALEEETVRWCREMLDLSPFALRLMKASFNAADDGFAGLQQLAHDANLLFYMSDEAQEGRDAYMQRRPPDFSKFPRRP